MDVPVSSPIQEVGCWVNTKKYVIQPGNIVLDPVKKPSPSQAITAKPPDLQPEKKKKRKKKKSKKRKTAEVVSDPSNEPAEVIADPCTEPEDVATRSRIKKKRKKSESAEPPSDPSMSPVRLKMPTHLLHSLLAIVVIFPIFCHTLICTKSVPVLDFPIFLHQKDQKFHFQQPDFCPRRVDVFVSCSACFENMSSLRIVCSFEGDVEIRVESGKRNGKSKVVTMSPADCEPFVEEEPTEKPKEEQNSEIQNGSQKGAKEKPKTEKSEKRTPAGANDGASYGKVIGLLLLVTLPVGCLIYVIKDDCERRRQVRRLPPAAETTV